MLFFVSTQNLIIYKFDLLYHVLKELSPELKFNTISINSNKLLEEKIKDNNNYLIISKKKYLDFKNQIVLDNLPIKIFKLFEKINIEFLKTQFNNQSKLKVASYIIDLNSREITKESITLKLTEKEINTILYLSRSNIPISIDELKKKVWSYNSEMESHTVETHVYRLRKKILNTFNDSEFIISKKNGYQIE